MKFKNVGKEWVSSPYLEFQNPVILPTVPLEQLEFLGNVSEIIKIYGSTEIRTRTYCWEMFVSPDCRGRLFENKNTSQKYIDKKRNDPANWMISCIFNVRRKIKHFFVHTLGQFYSFIAYSLFIPNLHWILKLTLSTACSYGASSLKSKQTVNSWKSLDTYW